MNNLLRLTLLGTPRIRLGDQLLTDFATNKAQALLFYLAVTGRPHSRDALATLLWDDMSDAQAKKNLRTVLPDLRRRVGGYLQIDRQTIAFDHTSAYWLDVEVLRQGLSPELTAARAPLDAVAHQQFVDLYQGEFLSGFYVQNASLFDAWVLQQREQLHTLVIEALFSLVAEQTQRAAYTTALAANRRLLELEPWSEPVHRRQMWLLAQTGDRAAALAQYELCQRSLAAEFGISPLADTTALYEQIRAGEFGEPVAGERARQAPRREGASVATEVQANANVRSTEAIPPLQVAGHALPQRIKLYGRELEGECLYKWVVEGGCRLVGILGIGGQGKSALAATFVRRLTAAAPEFGGHGGFTRVIWHSLVNAPPITDVMQEWLSLLSDQTAIHSSLSLDQQFSRLLEYLRHQRCLLILDNLESVLQGGERSGYYRPGYEAYGQLLRQLAEGDHRSCLLLTSREQPHDLTQLAEDTPAVRFLSLAGLPTHAGRQMLTERGLADAPTDLNALVQQYSGNPLALKLVAETVQGIFANNIAAFLQAETLVFDDIRDVLDQQFGRLTPLENELMGWLAIVREPITYLDLRHLLAQPPAARLMLEAVRSLQRRSLVETYDEGFGLQNVVLEYTTEWLVDHMYNELRNGVAPTLPEEGLDIFEERVARTVLNRTALILAQTKEYVRASQQRLLLQPVAERLLQSQGRVGAAQRIQMYLATLHRLPPIPGYAATNLLHLLLQLEVDLRGYDFSQLYLRQLYLRGVTLPQVNFARAELVESLFTDPFGLIYATIFSPDGHYLAAGTSEGDIYLWRTADQQLVQVLRGHSQGVRALSFADYITQDGEPSLLLASAGDDGSVGLWLMTSSGQIDWQTRLTHEQQKLVVSVNVGPMGRWVTSVDNSGYVFVWKVNAHVHEAQLAHHFVTTPTRLGLVAYSGDGRTIAVGNRAGSVQLHQIATGEIELELAHTIGPIAELDLSQDGRLLAIGGLNGQLCLWSIPERQVLDIVGTEQVLIDALAFSPDGKLLASTHSIGSQAIRVWHIDEQQHLRLQQTLLGHTQNIWSVAFGPLPTQVGTANAATDAAITRQLLVTGSTDQSVRVWDVQTGHLLYTQRGQPRVLSAIAIHPLSQTARSGMNHGVPKGEWLLAAVGYDRLVHLWIGQGTQIDRKYHTLTGSSKALYAVAISPAGRTVAAAGHDHIVYLWDVAGGQLLQTLQGHTGAIECMAFQSEERLITSSINGEVRFWEWTEAQDPRTGALGHFQPSQPAAIHQAHPSKIQEIAVSPNGAMLAAVGGNCSLRLWDMTQPRYPELTRERRTIAAADEHEIFSVAFSPDNKQIACGGNYLIHLWNLHNDAPPLVLRRHTAQIFSVAFSPDGTTLASGSLDCTICLWDVESGTLRSTLHGHTEIVYQVLFSPDGALLLSCSADGTIRFWDVRNPGGAGDCIHPLRVDGPYAGMNITDSIGLTAPQRTALKTLGAVELDTSLAAP